MTKDKALKLALEFIERVNKDGWILADFEPEMYAAITAIKESLKQSEQEPVAWITNQDLAYMKAHALLGAKDYSLTVGLVEQKGDVPLYTAPQREWVGLTDAEVQNIVYCRSPNIANLRKAEQLLKDKNT